MFVRHYLFRKLLIAILFFGAVCNYNLLQAQPSLPPEVSAVKEFYDKLMRADRSAYDESCNKFYSEVESNARWGIGVPIPTLVMMDSLMNYREMKYSLIRTSRDGTIARVRLTGIIVDDRGRRHDARSYISGAGYKNIALSVYERGRWRFCGLVK